MKSLAILVTFLISVEFCIVGKISVFGGEQNNFLTMLSCTEINNVTIVIETWFIGDKILLMLNEIKANDACFIVNLYLNGEDRVVQVGKADDLLNILMRNRKKFETHRVRKLADRLHRENIMGDADGIKLTFFLLEIAFGNRELSQSLRKLQEEKKWAIIIWSSYETREPTKWLPLHRYFLNDGALRDGTLTDIYLKDVKDVIQNPDFDRGMIWYIAGR